MIPQIKLTISGLPEVARTLGRGVDKLEEQFCLAIVEESRALIDESVPSGRVYRRGSFRRGQSRGLGFKARGPGSRFHRASAPGQPPAKDSGRTYKDISVRRLSSGNYRIRFGGASGYLEIGTGRMKARPYIVPAIKRAAERIFK